MPTPLSLSEIPRTSPTLWSHMRLCGLRAVLASTLEADRWVLHDPRAWLGTAFHRVMEAAGRNGAAAADAEAVWNAAIANAVAAATSHPLDSRFSIPERWPGYFLVRQRALALASKTAATIGAPDAGAGSRASNKTGGAERRLQARGGRLAGRPDRFDAHTITEYKSSLPDPSWSGAEEVIDGFRRQVRLYAVIIAEATGVWPAHGRVVAASGQIIDVPLDPAACGAEADAALAALDTVNRGLAPGTAPEALARPAPLACGGCPFQAICPAFWRWLHGADAQQLADVGADGILQGIELGQDGDLYTAFLALRFSTHQLNVEQSLVLRRSVHGDLTASGPGARWRIVSARLRPDGRLRADISTVVFAVRNLPALTTA